jgi:hypothetical protein
MSQVSSISQAASSIDLGPSGSLQLQYAKLQLALSEMSKKGALDYIDQIKKSHDDQKKLADLLNEARQAQREAKTSGKATAMSPEVIKYLRDNNLAYDKTDETKINKDIEKNDQKIATNEGYIQLGLANKHAGYTGKLYASTAAERAVELETVSAQTLRQKNDKLQEENDGFREKLNNLSFKDEAWEVAVTSLKNHQDTIGINTQQLMVFVSDYMGQYNSYLQGANSTIQQSSQTLAELARIR